MSTLHDRLLRWFDHGAPSGDLEDAIAREEAALRAVVELHAPEPRTVPVECSGCDLGVYAAAAPDWPCSTITAIADALGVEIGETPK